MAGFDTRNALNLAIRALSKAALERNAGGWIPPKEQERQQRDAMRQEQQQARQAEKQQKETARAEEKQKREAERKNKEQNKLLSKQFPTQYMPNVGRQVMADGGDVGGDTATFKGRKFWSGIFDSYDGAIREVHPYHRAKAVDFHHSHYVSPHLQDAMRQGDAGFFWVDRGGKVNTLWRDDEAPKHIVDAIHGQIDVIGKAHGGEIGRQVMQDGGVPDDKNQVGLYSKASRVAAALPQKKATGAQMVAALRDPKRGVKKEELINAGVMLPTGEAHPDWANRSVTADELAQHFRDQQPQIEERVLGQTIKGQPYPEEYTKIEQSIIDKYKPELDALDRQQFNYSLPQGTRLVAQRKIEELRDKMYAEIDATLPSDREQLLEAAKDKTVPTKYQEWTLPGGENYREVLLRLPEQQKKSTEYPVIRPDGLVDGRYDSIQNAARRALEINGSVGDPINTDRVTGFRSPHWSDLNVLAHIRMADRTGPNGEKILHVEELQSDWGQKGKKTGFESQRKELNQDVINKEKASIVAHQLGMSEEEKAARLAAYNEANARLEAFEQHGRAVPDAPYVTSTEGWTDLALKRVLKEAAEGGYDKIVFTPGKEQAKRYNLSNYVDRLAYDPEEKTLSYIKKGTRVWTDHPESVEPDKLHSVIGKDAAKQLLETKPNKLSGIHQMNTQDLVIGEEGMKGYYDKIVPSRLQDIVKKHDPNVRVSNHNIADKYHIATPNGQNITAEPFDNEEQANDTIRTFGRDNPLDLSVKKVPFQMQGIDVTPQLRESVMKGQEAYARGGEVEREGLAGGGSPDNDMIRDALSRVASPFSDNPELAAKAVEIANRLYKIPQGTETEGSSYYGFKGKDPIPVSDVQATVEPIPGVTPLEPNPMSWEDFYKVGKGGTMINLGGDRSRLGRLTHINGKKLGWPVDLHAGPEYMLEPNPGAVWANADIQTQAIRNKILKAAEKGPVYGVYTPMGPETVDASHHMFDALMSQIAADPPSKKVAKQVDDSLIKGKFIMGNRPEDVKEREKAIEYMQGWPGVLNAKEASAFAKNLPSTIRSRIVKHLDKDAWYKIGLPHVGRTRVAITNPDLVAAPANMMGYRIAELSPEKVTESAFKHGSYQSPTAGTYKADVPLVQRQYAAPDVMDQFLSTRAGKGDIIMHPYSLQPGGRNAFRKMLEEQKHLQPINQRMLDSIQQGLERQSKYGLKDGGEVDREGLAGGGNPGDIAGGGYGDGNIGGGSSGGGGSDSPTTGGDQYGGDQYGGNDNYSGSGGRDTYTSYGDGGPDLGIGGPQGLTGAAAFGRPELGTDTYNLDNAPPTTVGAKLAASPNIGADLVKEAVTPDLGTANSPFASGAQSYDQAALDAINERMKTDQQVLRDAAVQRTIGDRPSTIGIPNAPTSTANMYNMAGGPLTEGSYADAQSIYNQRLYNSVFGPEKETGAQISVPNAGDLYGATNAPLAIQQTPVSAPSPTANQSLEEYMGTVPPADMQQMITKQLQKTNQFNVNVKDFLDATGSPLSYATTYGMALPKLAEKNINFQPGQKIDPATGLPATGIATFTGNMNAKLTPEQQAAKDEFDKQFGKTFTPITKTTYGVEERGPMMGGDLTGPSMTFDSFSQMAPQEQTEAQTPVVASDVMRGTMGITPPAPAEPRVGMPQLAQQPIQIPQSQTQAQTNPSVPSYSSSLQPQQTIRQNFEQAFADARASGAQTFYWTNPKTGVTSLYGTKIARKEGGRVPSFNEPDEWLAEKNESKKNAVKKANKRTPKPERSPIVGRALMLSSSKS